MIICPVCFHHCHLLEGQKGLCKARANHNEKMVSLSYGYVSSMALDPIEKKPLKRFYPGSYVLSIGSYGCNLRCPFCQNFEISQEDLGGYLRYVSPKAIVDKAIELKKNGNIGIAFTYNEPLCSFEFVRDVSKLAKSAGLKTVLVSNGTASQEVLLEILPFIDAMNIDLKGFSSSFYEWVGGNFEETKSFIVTSAKTSHVELTTLVIPGKNDSLDLMEEEAKWIASISKDIPLHLTRYFPIFNCNIEQTPLKTLQKLKEVAQKYLSYVYLGNV